MKNLLSFTNFTDHVKVQEVNKTNEETKKYRNKLSEAFKNLLEEMGISKLSELDEDKKKKIIETIFNESEMARLSNIIINEEQ
jgi:hypothetical protein